MARPRVPMERREVEGTVRAKHRKKAEGSPKMEIVVFAELPGLAEEAQEHWPMFRDILAKMRVTTESDYPAVVQLVQTYADWQRYRKVLEEEGEFYKARTKNGEVTIRQHPALSAMQDCARQLRQLLADFGMNPVSRTKVKTDGDDSPQDPLQEFGF